MKFLGFYISSVNYAEKYIIAESNLRAAEETLKRTKRECEEAHTAYTELVERYNNAKAQMKDLTDEISVRNEDIKEIRSQLADVKSAKVELSERLEKEQSDNCELQNLYAEKCKECDALDDKLALVNAELDKSTKEKEAREKQGGGMVVVEEEYLKQLKADAEKFRADREKHNENRRKRRAAKKASAAKTK